MSDEQPPQAPTEYRDPDATIGSSGGMSGGQAGFAAGDIVADRYQLVRMLGHGGMGVVWVARSFVLGIDVAIKLIRPDAAKPEMASRMAREAQVTASIGHPALVRVFDFGVTPQGAPFLVMELAQGETLGAMLRREQRLSAVQAVQMLLPLADGLRCAHERGVVHRDIKPENVFIARDALGRVQPKLLDFGIAKLEHQQGDGRLTQMGAVLGSPEFMSPEQARGDQDTDVRTDVWSFCVMLYEMLTGTVPFKDKNYNALMQSILNDAPVPITQFAAGDHDLWLVIERGLEKAKDERWRSMGELGEALALWLYERGVKEDLSGNSVKALWLGGSLSGLTSENPERPHKPGRIPTLAQRVQATAGRRFRRVRKRLMRLSVRVAAAVVLLVLVAALFSTRRSAEPTREGPKAAAQPQPAPTLPSRALEPVPAPAITPEALPSLSPPPEAAPRAAKTAPAAPAARRAPQRPAAPQKKGIRDFGF
jgi:serine/threonine-protein kinase